MQKILTPDEKIRRAEAIYYKRKMILNNNYTREDLINDKKNFYLLKKIILQVLICIVLYSIFYMIQNNEYVFSNDVLNKTKEILAYDINLSNLYNQAEEKIKMFINRNEKEIQSVEDEEISEASVTEDVEEANSDEENNQIELNQMEQDAKDILSAKSLIIPLNGTITSRFGNRESENPIVTTNHTGIDIAANEGTVFIASMAGKVTEVSNKRRFR